MSFALLTTLCLLLLAIAARNSVRREKMLQYPFLVSAVIAGWVLPQLIGLYLTDRVASDALNRTVVYIILCLLFGVWGYSTTSTTYRMAKWEYAPQRLQIAAAGTMAVGALFQARFQALAAEATALYSGFWTGTITIYVFLASMFTIGFVLAIASYIQKPTFLNRAMIAFGLVSYLQRIVILGRREVAVELFVIVALFLWRKYGWAPSRLLFLGAIVGGMLFVQAAGVYRGLVLNAETYSWSGVSLSQILEIEYWQIFTNNLTDSLANQELLNAVLSITATDIRLQLDWGVGLWNRFVFSFIPGQIVGHDLKQSLMFSQPNLALEVFNHIPWPGTTYTGFADSFRSFWYFGAFVFFAIGVIMKKWFIGAARGSLTAFIVLALITSQSLIAVTHNSYDFFLFFVNLAVFLLPPLLFARKKPSSSRYHR